jgi:hypothetical protein
MVSHATQISLPGSPSTLIEYFAKPCTWIWKHLDGTRYMLRLSPPFGMSSEEVGNRFGGTHERISREFYSLATVMKGLRDSDAREESASSLEEDLADSINQVGLTSMAAFMNVHKFALKILSCTTCDNSTDSHEILAYVVEAEVRSQKLKCWLELTEPRTQVSLDV